ncbi:hypothetical protein FRB90_008024 [Tulasnella sp. 427]|nr:hypothetical protein FRB90_008024 [Tulasnella sp. 427]
MDLSDASLTPPLGTSRVSDQEFELLGDDEFDLDLSQMKLDDDEGSSEKLTKSNVWNVKATRASRQAILRKYSSSGPEDTIPAPSHVKIYFISRSRSGFAVLQSGDGVAEHDFSPSKVRILSRSHISWSKSSPRESSGFFLELLGPSEEEKDSTSNQACSDREQTRLEPDIETFELFTTSRDSTPLTYHGTVETLPETLPDLVAREWKSLSRHASNLREPSDGRYAETRLHFKIQTRRELMDELYVNPSPESAGTTSKNPLRGSHGLRIKCIGFRRIGANADLYRGKFAWSRQKLSAADRTYLLSRQADPDLVPVLDIPKTARRVRRLPKVTQGLPQGTAVAGSSSDPMRAQRRPPVKATSNSLNPTFLTLEDLTADFAALDTSPPVFRASKRKRDDRATAATTSGQVHKDASPNKKTRTFIGIGEQEKDVVPMDVLDTKPKKKGRRVKKSKARRMQDKEIKQMAAILSGLTIGAQNAEEDDDMEEDQK